MNSVLANVVLFLALLITGVILLSRNRKRNTK